MAATQTPPTSEPDLPIPSTSPSTRPAAGNATSSDDDDPSNEQDDDDDAPQPADAEGTRQHADVLARLNNEDSDDDEDDEEPPRGSKYSACLR